MKKFESVNQALNQVEGGVAVFSKTPYGYRFTVVDDSGNIFGIRDGGSAQNALGSYDIHFGLMVERAMDLIRECSLSFFREGEDIVCSVQRQDDKTEVARVSAATYANDAIKALLVELYDDKPEEEIAEAEDDDS